MSHINAFMLAENTPSRQYEFMSNPEKSLLTERMSFIEAAKPIWDDIYDSIDQLLEGNEDGVHTGPTISGEVYDWEFLVGLFYSSGFTSPWGHTLTEGFSVELWFSDKKGARRPPELDVDGTRFCDDSKAMIVCTKEGIYDGHTFRILDIDELAKFQLDVDRIIDDASREKPGEESE